MNDIFPRAASLTELHAITKYARNEVDMMFTENRVSQVNRKKSKVCQAFLLKNTEILSSSAHFQSLQPEYDGHNYIPTLIIDEKQSSKIKMQNVHNLELPDTFINLPKSIHPEF